MKKILFILICFCLLFSGCAHTPLPTASLISSIKNSTNANNLHFTFIDSRSTQLKTEKCFVLQHIYPTWIFTCGDAAFDSPLNISFQKMFLKRFPDNPKGYQTEVKLVTFHWTHKPHELSGIPLINIFVIAADVEFHGIIKMEVAILDRNGKFIFTKIYDSDIKEMKPCDTVLYLAGLDMLNKVFEKVTDEFEKDLKRIKFD